MRQRAAPNKNGKHARPFADILAGLQNNLNHLWRRWRKLDGRAGAIIHGTSRSGGACSCCIAQIITLGAKHRHPDSEPDTAKTAKRRSPIMIADTKRAELPLTPAKLRIVSLAGVLLFALVNVSRAALTFYVDPGSPWPAGWYDAAVANMQTTVNMYNAYGDFTTNNPGNIYVYYNAGIPTAQSGYGGYGGSIGDGGTYPNVRVLLHESSHWLGTGTYSANWSGFNTALLMRQFDGEGAVLNGDSAHYWPYGENYDNESSPINDRRHVAIVYSLRQDFGIAPAGNPSSWAATSVTLAASDAVGESGFNYPWTWSDNTFAHPNADYSTGNFSLRTPTGYPSWTFAGRSLTVNSGGSLLFNSWGTTGVITIKNLNLSGTVRHDQNAIDTFQLAGNVTLTGTPTVDAASGPIQISATLGGAGSLTKTGPYSLTLDTGASYTGNTTISAGVLRLSPVTPIASYTFDSVSGSTVNNTGSGGASMNGTLVGGAAITAGGHSGNAVSLSGGASVDINNPITSLEYNGNWTVSAWVKPSTPGSTILSKSDGGWGSGNTIFYLGDGTAGGSGGIPSAVRWGGGFVQGSASATNVINNAWHQVTYVNSGGNYAIYVDGVTQSLSSGNAAFGNFDVGSIIRLGYTTNTVAGDGTVHFNGFLDDVQFYNQALSSTQVASLYQGNSVTGTLPSSTNVTIASGATLDLNGATQQIGSLTGGAASSVVLGSGRLTVNSSANTQFAGLMSGTGGSLVKQGAGVLTLSGVNTFTGTTTISQGTLKLGSNPVSVAHRWSFNSSLADSIGTSPATIVDVGANNVTLSATRVTLAGGARDSSDYVSLGSNLLPKANVPVTIELWATQNTVNNWSRVFDFGNDTTENLFMSWTQGTNLASDRVEWKDSVTNTADNTNQPYTLGAEYHIAMVLMPVGNSTQVTWYAAPATSNSLGAAKGTFTSSNTLTNFINSADNLGRSFYGGDNTASASYDEVRFWNTALDSVTLQTLHMAGPDANLNSLNLGSVAGQLPSTTAVNISASGAALDLGGFNQTIGSLAGVAGSQVVLGSGALSTGGDNTSTTFAGVISGGGGSLVKQGAGTLTLTGTNTYTGPTTVSGGTLRVNGSIAGAVTVNSAAVLKGSGTIGGLVTVASGGVLAPGSSPGVLNVGSLNLNAGSQTQIELGGTTRGSQYDAVVAGGNINLNGTLNVSLINSFAPALGNSFGILVWNTESGVFSSVNLPALSAGLAWNTTKLYTSGALSVIDANYLPGDLDRDGQVNVADISALMSALADLPGYQAMHGPGGAQLTNQQLAQIGDFTGDDQVTNADVQGLINYLATGGGFGQGSLMAVPEPSCLALSITAAFFVSACFVRRKITIHRPG